LYDVRTRNINIYLTVVESTATDGRSTEAPVVLEVQTWGGDLGGTLESTFVVFFEFWLPFRPESIKLSEDITDLNINTTLVGSLQIGEDLFFWKITE